MWGKKKKNNTKLCLKCIPSYLSLSNASVTWMFWVCVKICITFIGIPQSKSQVVLKEKNHLFDRII